VLASDGDLMEGVSQEAIAMAGHWKLNKMIVLYDDNGISIDGPVEGWFRDDTPRRFEAYGWHVVPAVDGHDLEAIAAALDAARAVSDRPSLVCCRTVIGKGAAGKEGTAEAHGAPLGAAELSALRLRLGWDHPPFAVPPALRAAFDARPRGAAASARWRELLAAYGRAHPALAAELRRRLAGELSPGVGEVLERALAGAHARSEGVSTRKASQRVIAALAPQMPELLGGSADLTHSNLTSWSGARPVSREAGGDYVEWGVREFGMGAALNGLALHGGFVPFGGTFLVFSDYARSALRMAALMRLRSIFVLTHDSIGLGEDGPTHQPVEHAASLRLVPNLEVWRPCDAVETVAAWRAALERRGGPTALLLSRQDLPAQRRDVATLAQVGRGGYVLADAAAGGPQVVIIATGSEVQLGMDARALLATQGVDARVVSMPSTSAFDRQERAYREAVLPPGVPRVAVEAGVSDLWRKYVGLEGAVVGLDRFGESGPAAELFRHFGFTPERVAEAARSVLP
jgi:transketolase